MIKKQFIWKYIVSFSVYCSIFGFNSNSYSADIMYSDHVLMEEFLKGISVVAELARKCKSELNGQGCYEDDRQMLKKYAVYFCGEMPDNTHPMSKQYFEQYIGFPMLNTAFIRVWSWLNGGNLIWALCAVCLFDYPSHPHWEENVSFCD